MAWAAARWAAAERIRSPSPTPLKSLRMCLGSRETEIHHTVHSRARPEDVTSTSTCSGRDATTALRPRMSRLQIGARFVRPGASRNTFVLVPAHETNPVSLCTVAWHQPHRPTLHPHIRMVRAHGLLQASEWQLRTAPSQVLRRIHVRRQAPRPARRSRLPGEASRLMRPILTALALAAGPPAIVIGQAPVDSSLTAFIARIRAVDNHTHVNTVVARDSEFDALPLDGLPPFALPARISADNP